MKKITKAVIPAAGLGTRFLPATKTTPKEMLPIVDRPILLYVVEEAVKSGITDIILIAGREKTSIEDFFDCSYELEDMLQKTRRFEELEKVQRIKSMANVISIRQKQTLGLGHAVSCARPIVGNEPFAVLLGDEVMVSTNQQPTAIAELADIALDHQCSSVAVMPVADEQVSKYGIIKIKANQQNQFPCQVEDLIEKPTPDRAPSRLAITGRYILDSKIFDYLADQPAGVNGEIQLTDALCKLAKNQGLVASTVQAKRYDAGDKLGYLQANVEMALAHPELGVKFRQYLSDLVKTW